MTTIPKEARQQMANTMFVSQFPSISEAAEAAFEIRVQSEIEVAKKKLKKLATTILGVEVEPQDEHFTEGILSTPIRRVGFSIDGLNFGLNGDKDDKLAVQWSTCAVCGVARPSIIASLADLGWVIWAKESGYLADRYGDYCGATCKELAAT